jgi:NADH:ubiquinone oxidoreductase subunit F (NADH-binding)
VSVSGDVNRPGVYEVPFGLTVGDLIEKHCGGMRGGRRLKAIAPSGPSGGFLPAVVKAENVPERFVKERMQGAPTYNVLDLPLDLNTLGLIGSMLGAAFVVYDETRDMVDQALNCTQFFRNESCGKCVPCRMGSQKLVEMLTAIREQTFEREGLGLVQELGDTMLQTSICGLGQVVPNPITSVMRHFKADLDPYFARAADAAPKGGSLFTAGS